MEVVKRGRREKFEIGEDYGLLAYNENPFFEVIESGVSSIGIEWKEMGRIASEFILNDISVHEYLPTIINKRDSF